MNKIINVLEITDDIRKALTESGVVICSYKSVDGSSIDGISIDHAINHQELKQVSCIVSENQL